ncbi:hypothetical protein ACROYT_G018034 [Oculina patagonica]
MSTESTLRASIGKTRLISNVQLNRVLGSRENDVLDNYCKVGSPIPMEKVENPSEEQITELHSEYTRKLKELFDEHRDACGESKDTELVSVSIMDGRLAAGFLSYECEKSSIPVVDAEEQDKYNNTRQHLVWLTYSCSSKEVQCSHFGAVKFSFASGSVQSKSPQEKPLLANVCWRIWNSIDRRLLTQTRSPCLQKGQGKSVQPF